MPRPSYLPDLGCGTNTAALTEKQREDLREYVRELTAEGRHLEASTLYSSFFPWA